MGISTPLDVLIVDDSDADRLLFKTCISDPNVNLLEAASVDDALDLLKEIDVDGIVLDIQMPGADGIELLKIIRDETRSTWPPIFVWSSSKQWKDVRAAYESYANLFIQKPKSLDGMERIVRIVLEVFELGVTLEDVR